MKAFCSTNHRICNVALSTFAIILVCCIDCKAQSTVGIEFFMNDTIESLDDVVDTSGGSSSSIENTYSHGGTSSRVGSSNRNIRRLTMPSLGVAASLMNNETESETVVSSSNVDDINLTSSSSVSAATMSSSSITEHKTTLSSSIELLNKIVSQAQPLVMASTTSSPNAADASMNSDNMLDEISTSNVTNTNTTATSITRPFVLPFTIPPLRPRVVHQRPYSKHHHDHLWGPFFEEPVSSNNITNGTLKVNYHLGTEAILNCRVGMLKDKTVMWLQRTIEKVSLLTVGNVTYSGDPRISVKFQYPNNWRLHINPLRHEDGGLYLCQVSTHPPKVFSTDLTVLAPAVRVVDEMGHDVNDRYYKLGSLIDITCQVAVSYLATLPPVASEGPKQQTTKTGPNVINMDTKEVFSAKERLHYLNHKIEWKKDGDSLPGDVKISLSISKNWKNSRLTILHAYKSHSGTYTCSVFNASTAAAHVQVLNGETPAAVQHNSGNVSTNNSYVLSLLMVLVIVLSVPKLYCSSTAMSTQIPSMSSSYYISDC